MNRIDRLFDSVENFLSGLSSDTKKYIMGGMVALIFELLIIVAVMYTVYVDRPYKETESLKAEIVVLKAKLYGIENSKKEGYNQDQKDLSIYHDKQRKEVIRAKATIAGAEAIKRLMGSNYRKVDKVLVYKFSAAFYDMSIKYNHDIRELFSIAWHENRFNPHRKSIVGACGPMQIMPLWVKGKSRESRLFMRETGISSLEELCDDVRNNIEAAAWIYRHYKNLWIGRGVKSNYEVKRLAQLSYNRGPWAVQRALNNGINPSNGYDKVIRSKVKLLTKYGFFIRTQQIIYKPLSLSY